MTGGPAARGARRISAAFSGGPAIRARRRLLAAALALAAAAAGCRAPLPTADPPPPVRDPVAPPADGLPPADMFPTPPIESPPSVLDLLVKDAERAAESADLATAVDLLAAALERPEATEEERSAFLLRLAVWHADPSSPVRDPARARRELDRLETEYPATLEAAQGRMVRGFLERAAELEAKIGTLERDLREARTKLERREEELRRIKEILLEEKAPD